MRPGRLGYRFKWTSRSVQRLRLSDTMGLESIRSQYKTLDSLIIANGGPNLWRDSLKHYSINNEISTFIP